LRNRIAILGQTAL